VVKKKKTQAWIKLVNQPHKLALGDDIMLPEVPNMAEREVVGRENGRHLGISLLRDWVKKSWTGLLTTLPSVHLLSKGWFMLKFQCVADATKVLKDPWCIDSTPLLLKRWTSFFDASTERIDELPIWVHLPGLPPELWTAKGFKCIGNALGNYMDVNMSFISSGRMSMAHILVSLNVRKGLSGEIELSWGNIVFMQKLDYEGIPFKCHRCHKHGHRVSECPLPMK
jgi:hypothetical protein